MQSLIIRQAKPGDAASLAELSGLLGYPVNCENMQGRLGQLDGRDDHVVFVAEAEGEIVGWIHGAEQHNLVSDGVAEICGLVVADGRRISGVGRRLVEAVEQWASARGLVQIS